MRPNDDCADRDARARSRPSRRLVLGGVAAATASLAGCARVGEAGRRTGTETFTVPGESVDRLVVAGGDGDTDVRGWDGADVRVEARTYAVGGTDLADVTVTREVRDGRLSVGVDVGGGVGLGRSGGGLEALSVRVPSGVRVDRVSGDDGSVRVRDVAGDPVLAVDDGRVDADGLAGAVEVSADDGEATLGAVGRLTGSVDDGRLRTREATTLGDVRADDGELDLLVDGLDGDATVRSDDGRVRLALSPTLDATVSITVDDGSLSVEGDLFETVETSAGTTRGTLGTGRHRLTVSTDDGSVTVRPLGDG